MFHIGSRHFPPQPGHGQLCLPTMSFDARSCVVRWEATGETEMEGARRSRSLASRVREAALNHDDNEQHLQTPRFDLGSTKTELPGSIVLRRICGKIVLPWKPSFRPKVRLCCLVQFGANWDCRQATRSTQRYK